MRCPFCAEEIQDAAIVCRHCGASRTDGPWRPPPAPVGAASPKPPKGLSTLHLAGVLFLLSAALEAWSWQDGVPLAGTLRTGALAVAYHAILAGVHLSMGVSLLALRSWCFPLFLSAAAVYALDRAAFLLDTAAVQAYLAQQAAGLDGMGDLIEAGGDVADVARLAQDATRWTTGLLLACFLGFVVYVVARRHLFGRPR